MLKLFSQDMNTISMNGILQIEETC